MSGAPAGARPWSRARPKYDGAAPLEIHQARLERAARVRLPRQACLVARAVAQQGRPGAGEPRRYLVAGESFFTGLDVDVQAKVSLTDPELSFHADFEPGPLFALVDGDIEFDGVLPTDASLRLRTELMAAQIVTRQTYGFEPPYHNDEVTVVMNTTTVPLDDLESALGDEGIGLVMTGTHLYTEQYDQDELLTEATFMMHELDGHRWSMAGPYSTVRVA